MEIMINKQNNFVNNSIDITSTPNYTFSLAAIMSLKIGEDTLNTPQAKSIIVCKLSFVKYLFTI